YAGGDARSLADDLRTPGGRMSTRTLHVDLLARVEGEGALRLAFEGETLTELSLSIFEPPRFFEALLRGRPATDAPDVTARICGICPVAYQMSACAAIEDAWGVVVPDALTALRRALYCGEWIESHVLHMLMLHVPDFLGLHSVVEVAEHHRDQVQAALAVKKAGNALVTMLGGREIHPVNVRVGGFYRLPRPAERDAIVAQLSAVRAPMEAFVRWVGGLPYPELDTSVPFVALHPPSVYPFLEGPIGTSDGDAIEPADWGEHFVEEHVERSNALHCRLHGAPYLTGPLARFALSGHQLPEPLRTLAHELGCDPPVRNPFRSLLVRGIETLYAIDEAVRLLAAFEDFDGRPCVPAEPRAAVGVGVSEAPRGLLYHRYETDADGHIVRADIVPPTSQNQLAIEADLRTLAPQLRTLDDEPARRLAEQAIRNHDPCISCATHFLRLSRGADSG
ncbi:MAG: nickel-dependent hydrogenase large subunit, partial [Myxococcota bacterium]